MYSVLETGEPYAWSIPVMGDVILPTRAGEYTNWQSSPTASTQQAPLHPRTECVLLYLFIHFHVAKCCQCDEWELELANCFHSTGQVSHALNLNVHLVSGALPFSRFLDRRITAATFLTHTQTPALPIPPPPDFPAAFLIRIYLRNWSCSLQFHLHSSECLMLGGDYGVGSSFSGEWWGWNHGGCVEPVWWGLGAIGAVSLGL